MKGADMGLEPEQSKYWHYKSYMSAVPLLRTSFPVWTFFCITVDGMVLWVSFAVPPGGEIALDICGSSLVPFCREPRRTIAWIVDI